MVKCRLIPLIGPQSTSQSSLDSHINQHLIDILIDTQLTSLTVNRVLIEGWSSVDQVSIKMSIEMSIKGINQHSRADAFSTHDLDL